MTHVSGENNENERIVSRGVSAAGVRSLIVRTDFGSVTVEPSSDASQIKVVATVTLSDNSLSKSDREKYLNGFAVPDTAEGDEYTARVVPPEDLPKNLGWTVSYHVSVPPSMALDLQTENGMVVVRDTETTGRVFARSEFGAITVVNAGSTVDAQTENGAVTIEGKTNRESISAHSEFGAVSVTGPAKVIDAQTENGEVRVAGAPDAETVTARSSFGAIHLENVGGEVDAQTENGAVRYSGTPKALTLKSEFGAIDARLGDCDSLTEGRLTTSNGAITLTLPASASVSLTGTTENGDITTNGFTGQIAGDGFNKTLRATRNGGQVPIDLSTDFGSLTVTAE